MVIRRFVHMLWLQKCARACAETCNSNCGATTAPSHSSAVISYQAVRGTSQGGGWHKTNFRYPAIIQPGVDNGGPFPKVNGKMLKQLETEKQTLVLEN